MSDQQRAGGLAWREDRLVWGLHPREVENDAEYQTHDEVTVAIREFEKHRPGLAEYAKSEEDKQ